MFRPRADSGDTQPVFERLPCPSIAASCSPIDKLRFLSCKAVMRTLFVVLTVLQLVSGTEAEMDGGMAGLKYCGGDPFSSFWANLVSVPCDAPAIDDCCFKHDKCYESPYKTQEDCDAEFCGCLDRIPTNMYCATFAQPGLCLATQVFGHQFHWSSQCQYIEAVGDHDHSDDEDENSTVRTNCLLAADVDNWQLTDAF